MILTLIAAAALAQASDTVELVRGAHVNGLGVWDVEDATVDAVAPNANMGGDALLTGASTRTILIRFGDIDRLVPPNRRVRKASLVFTVTGGDAPQLRSISRLLVPWGEGPYQTIDSLVHKPVQTGATKKDEPSAPRGSATWRERRAGLAGWQQAGARGPSDAEPIAGAKGAGSAEFTVTGLEKAVQAMADRPYDNDGFALSFENPVEFASSQSQSGRPRLVLELEPTTPESGPDLSVTAITRTADGFVAHVKNVGNAPATGFSAMWNVGERAGSSQDVPRSLGPGEETTLSYQAGATADKTDHRFPTIGLRIRTTGRDVNPRNDGLDIPIAAKTVEVALSPAAAEAAGVPEDWVQRQVRAFNDVYLAQSRFSFAPEGAKERVSVQRVLISPRGVAGEDGSPRVQVDTVYGAGIDPAFMKTLAIAIGLPDRGATSVPAARNGLVPRGGGDLYPGLLGYGDTRYEGLLLGGLPLNYEPVANPALEAFPMEPTGLLSGTDIATLNAALGGTPLAMPRTIMLRAQGIGGDPLGGLKLDFFRAKDGAIAKDAPPIASVATNDQGIVVLPANTLGQDDALLVRGTANGASDWTWIKGWQAVDAASRGNRAAAFLDLRFSLAGAPLETDVNLATDRIVTDSAGSLPAKLAALIDGDPSTAVTLGGKPNDWVEIDLGRDRIVGEVDLVAEAGKFWNRFDVLTYGTGQRPEDAVPWVREMDFGWRSLNRAEPTGQDRVTVAYRGKPRQFRYLRIVARSAGAGSLADIKVFRANVAQ